VRIEQGAKLTDESALSYPESGKMRLKTGRGKRFVARLITEERRRKISEYLKGRSRSRMIRKMSAEKGLHLKDLHRTCLKHIAPVREPLALISQIQRSGGSLLSQLFDGHPQVHAHPHELMLGFKKKFVWPRIDLNDRPESWFELLFEKMVIEHATQGYKKGRRDKEAFAFFFLPSLQKKIFLAYLETLETPDLRDVFNAYMTSYFGAWINNQNVNGQKKVVTAFTPRLAERQENTEYFFEVYPDGRLISVVRKPGNWYPSALRHVPEKYGELTGAIEQWNENTRAAIWNSRRYGERVCLVQFEDLIGKTEAVMRHLAGFLGLDYMDILLTPTFNNFPIRAHTSFEAEQSGIINGPLARYRTLSGRERETIERMTDDTWAEFLQEAVRFE
jgi:hypothetical protein